MARVDVAVLGSINMDIVLQTQRLPAPGETLIAHSITRTPGGKGANQAVAAARMGQAVRMLGAVGDDDAGAILHGVLRQNGVDADAVDRRDGTATGMAHVIVAASGENTILVLSGANAEVTPAYVRQQTCAAKVYLAQLETPVPSVEEFFRLGRDLGGTCILNAAPAVATGASVFPLADIIVLNESELASYAGETIYNNNPLTVARIAQTLFSSDTQTLIVTRGGRGVVAVWPGSHLVVEGRAVEVSDTTGAGDCFCGTLAAGLSGGRTLVGAIARANAAAALAVGRRGAALAAPYLADLESFLAAHPAHEEVQP